MNSKTGTKPPVDGWTLNFKSYSIAPAIPVVAVFTEGAEIGDNCTCMGRSGYLASNAGTRPAHAEVFKRSGKLFGNVASVTVMSSAPLLVADQLMHAHSEW